MAHYFLPGGKKKMSAYSLILPFVSQSTEKFVNAVAMREVISLALVSGKPAIFYGPGGHGKSEFVKSVFDCVDGARVFTQFFGEGMDESRLFGGVDLKAINDPANPRIEYNAERSWLAADLFVAEEGFDAPPVVLLSWKDSLTAKELRNGAQRFAMQTKAIILLTNRQPSELSDMGDAVQALVERFPLQLVVNWPKYEAKDFLAMFQALENAEEACPEFSLEELMLLREKAKKVRVPQSITMVLSELVAHAISSGGRISPRTAVHARDLVAASAAINGRDTADEQDIVACKYLPGMEAVAATIQEKIKSASQRAYAEALLRDAKRIFGQISSLVHSNLSIMDKLKVAALLEFLNDDVAEKVTPPAELVKARDELLGQISEMFGKLGGNTELYPDIKVILPDYMLGVAYQATVPQTGSKSIRELREEAEYAANVGNYDYDDDEDEDIDEDVAVVPVAKRPNPFGAPVKPSFPTTPKSGSFGKPT